MPLPPTLSVDAVQVSEMLLSLRALTASPAGTLGATVSAVGLVVVPLEVPTLKPTFADVVVVQRLSFATA